MPTQPAHVFCGSWPQVLPGTIVGSVLAPTWHDGHCGPSRNLDQVSGIGHAHVLGDVASKPRFVYGTARGVWNCRLGAVQESYLRIVDDPSTGGQQAGLHEIVTS